MKPIFEKLLAITFMVLKQEWITILPKVEVGYQRADSSFMSLIALKKNRQLEESFFYMYSCLESLEILFHKRGYDTMNNPSRNMKH